MRGKTVNVLNGQPLEYSLGEGVPYLKDLTCCYNMTSNQEQGSTLKYIVNQPKSGNFQSKICNVILGTSGDTDIGFSVTMLHPE